MGDKSVKKQISFPFWRLIISILAFSFLVGIATIVLCCKCGIFENIKVCKFVKCIIKVVIFLSVTSITLVFTAKALKPYAKMEFLKEIINKDIDNDYLQSLKDLELRDLVKEGITNQRDLIKKYCDTLADL
ncbi:MAG: hypothetical protein HDR35_06520 [Treponema sp.]|nr:hypothetical protein [Treponema sp.]